MSEKELEDANRIFNDIQVCKTEIEFCKKLLNDIGNIEISVKSDNREGTFALEREMVDLLIYSIEEHYRAKKEQLEEDFRDI